jgi:diadenosine tetraphosphate (Ap4A) HIT family hydrolase
MGHSVENGVALARRGEHPGLICRMPSGWVVLADMQYLRGYCILLADPVVSSLNDLSREQRAVFLLDMASIGDALMKVTGAYRINYAVMGNSDPYLHAHIVPRYSDEPEVYLHDQPWAYPREITKGRMLDEEQDRDLIEQLRKAITGVFNP